MINVAFTVSGCKLSIYSAAAPNVYHCTLSAVIDENVDFAVSAHPFTHASALDGKWKGANGVTKVDYIFAAAKIDTAHDVLLIKIPAARNLIRYMCI